MTRAEFLEKVARECGFPKGCLIHDDLGPKIVSAALKVAAEVLRDTGVDHCEYFARQLESLLNKGGGKNGKDGA